MSTEFELIAEDFDQDLEAIQSLVDAFKDPNTSAPRARIAAANSATLLLAASFEEFVREMAREYAKSVVAAANSIDKLPASLVNTAWRRTMELLGSIDAPTGGLPTDGEFTDALAKFNAVYNFCKGDLSQDIYSELIHNENNMRPREINSLFKVAGLSDVCLKVADKAAILENFGESESAKAHGRLLNVFEGFFERRNIIAHSLNLARSSGSDQIQKDVAMFKAFAKALCETLQAIVSLKSSAAGDGAGPTSRAKPDTGETARLVPSAESGDIGRTKLSPTDRYNAAEAEPRWQKVWDERGIFATPNKDLGKKYYVLEMFPYPSGRIHMGHVRNYTMGDVVARVKRALGFSVLHPMGWDAFGLPAENAAAERKVHPKKWTYDNIAAMKKQLKSMGLSLDWSREIATCDPAYYKHQQKMFLDFLRVGLVEREKRKLNWDPVDQHRARQRAGDRRPRLALRRAGRAARDEPVGLQDHEIFAGAARRARHARSLAGQSAADAEELDRPLGRPAGPLCARSENHAERRERAGNLHHAAGHVVRREIHGAGAGSSAGCGGSKEQSAARGVHRRVQTPRHRAGRDRHRGEDGLRHRHPGGASVRSVVAACRSMSRTSS